MAKPVYVRPKIDPSRDGGALSNLTGSIQRLQEALTEATAIVERLKDEVDAGDLPYDDDFNLLEQLARRIERARSDGNISVWFLNGRCYHRKPTETQLRERVCHKCRFAGCDPDGPYCASPGALAVSSVYGLSLASPALGKLCPAPEHPLFEEDAVKEAQ